MNIQPRYNDVRRMIRFAQIVAVLVFPVLCANARAETTNSFDAGVRAYRSGYFGEAADDFHRSLDAGLSSGALQNLGNVEWQRGRIGEAVLAWEQALWIDPFNAAAQNNLQFARETAQLESPELKWFEVASTWLPTNWWAWLTGISLWTAVGALVIPGALRKRRSAWQQVLAALGLGVFLLCIPAHLGTITRARIGFVLNAETGLRLTPTKDAETVTRLGAGETVRALRARGDYVFVRTSRSQGWLRRDEFGLVSEAMTGNQERTSANASP